ncbi:MAG TPA: hypothetical protein VFF14_02565 [Candidatus Deferrimicrobium sp.]|jgi:hypothetical protein|nr:hypothetical protein [Candidatus Deferrimicrobium sp.]
MQVALQDSILAVITTETANVAANVPVFFVASKEEQERLALLLSRIMNAMAHDLENGVFIIVKH